MAWSTASFWDSMKSTVSEATGSICLSTHTRRWALNRGQNLEMSTNSAENKNIGQDQSLNSQKHVQVCITPCLISKGKILRIFILEHKNKKLPFSSSPFGSLRPGRLQRTSRVSLWEVFSARRINTWILLSRSAASHGHKLEVKNHLFSERQNKRQTILTVRFFKIFKKFSWCPFYQLQETELLVTSNRILINFVWVRMLS